MRYFPPTITLKATQKAETARIRSLLVDANFDLDVWCEKLGFELFIVGEDVLPAPFKAYLYNDNIYVSKRLTRAEMQEAIAHEYCHAKYHSDSSSHVLLNKYNAGRDEGQAIAFANEFTSKKI